MNTPNVESIALQSLFQDLARRKLTDLIPLWQMMPAERMGMFSILSHLKPDVAIEIGTANGGSLAAISNYAKNVYTLDIDQTCEPRLGKYFKNVKFVAGDSGKTIPSVLEQIKKQKRHLEFVLIDGDHSREGVRRDINAILQYQPKKPMVIVMHDPFNPPCRFGMLDAKWSECPYVHSVDLDFVPGVAMQILDSKGTMAPLPFKAELPVWMYRGLAVAYLSPEPRKGKLTIKEQGRWLFDKTWPHTVHASIRFGAATASDQGYYGFMSSRSEAQMQAYLNADKEATAPEEPEGFFEIRARLADKIKKWNAKKAQVAIYGAGKHTLALLGLVPELHPLVSCFIDKNSTGEYLGKPAVKPEKFKSTQAQVVIYSSKAFEKEMHKSFKHHPVEHVRLYS